MAKLDDLIAHVADSKLRGQLQQATDELRRRKNFGLVYEEHIPETALLPATGIRKGAVVLVRSEPNSETRYVVDSLTETTAAVSAGGEVRTVPICDLLVVKPFGEPVYPTLRLRDAIVRSEATPFHTVINGENFHALQLLLFTYQGLVDCIYIDPPYNTGARDWRYNNRYVDSNDAWRHSKWLSQMERRLHLAKKLLRHDGVLIVTIDEHEVHHLGMLLEQIFPEAKRQLVTIVINPLGQARKQELARVDEYATFVFQGEAAPSPVSDDLLSANTQTARSRKVRWEWLIRGGTHSRRYERPNLFFPVYIDRETRKVEAIGDALPKDVDRNDIDTPSGLFAIWPLNTNGQEGNWRCSPIYLRELVAKGYAKVGAYDAKNDRYSLLYLGKAQINRISSGQLTVVGHDANGAVILEGDGTHPRVVTAKTVWNRLSHRAGEYGSSLLKQFVPGTDFPFPKSLYAVQDTLRIAVADRPNALVLDFFAGSGTTLHATCLLNAEDAGQRRCILVTNNEVSEAEAQALEEKGAYRGDADYEARGIFKQVTLPRCRAALTGSYPDGTPIPGNYLDGRPYEDGFEANAAFFDLEYADPDRIEIGAGLNQVAPALWLAAGAYGSPDQLEADVHWLIPARSPFAVLLDEDYFRSFRARLTERPDITHVWLVTDSEAAYARMREQIIGPYVVGMLYRDYLRNFRVNLDVDAVGSAR
jgi:adenine-specific DNA-methyltransferase